MKIVIDARIIATGTGRYVERLIHYLEQLDHTNEYSILVRKKDLNYYTPDNPRFKIVEADFKDYSFAEQLGLARLLYSLKPDLVHFCMPQQPLLYFGRTITTVHDLNLLRITANDDMGSLELRIKKVIFASLLWIVAHKSNHILAISHYTKNDLVRFSRINPQKVTVAYEGADTTTYPPKALPKLVGKDFLLYVGRAEPYKNNRLLIEAHQELLAHYPALRLVIAGKIDTLREGDIKWARGNGYTNVDFIGFVGNEELAWLYANTKAYVAPSLMEGFGLPALEAMSSGALVVASNTTATPEILGDAALYFDPTSTHDLIRVLGELLKDESIGKQFIERGHKQVKKYSWDRMARETLATYKQALK